MLKVLGFRDALRVFISGLNHNLTDDAVCGASSASVVSACQEVEANDKMRSQRDLPGVRRKGVERSRAHKGGNINNLPRVVRVKILTLKTSLLHRLIKPSKRRGR